MKMTSIVVQAGLLALPLLGLPLAAHAQQSQTAGDYANTVRLGVAQFNVHTDSSPITSNGPAFLTPQPAGLSVGDATTLLLVYTRKLNEHWDFDAEIGWPPSHDSTGTGTLAPFGVVAKVKEANPTAFVTYNFGTAQDTWRPFVGLGINFTHFFDAESTASGDLANGGPTKLSLSNSWGWAAKAGVAYKVNERWSVIGSVGTVKVKTDLTATTGSIVRTTTLDIRPTVFTLGVAYRF
jgi:outer membrane protein